MGDIRVDIGGLSSLSEAFGRGPTESAERMRVVLARSAGLVLDEARQKVPRGPSGAARASLTVDVSSGAALVVGGGRTAPYYPWLDFGGRVGRDRSTLRPFIRRGRFIYSALFSEEPRIAATLEEGVGDVTRNLGLT